jgi:competence protein ComEC
MLLWNPYYLLDIGFQLSFLVTFGLLIGVPPFVRILPDGMHSWLKNALAVTTVAQLIAFPLTVYYFNQFSLLSWFANLLLVPLVSILIYPIGLASLVLGMIWQPLGDWLAALVSVLNRALFTVIEYFSQFESMQLIIATPSFWWLLFYYALLTILLIILYQRKQLKLLVHAQQIVKRYTLFVWGCSLAFFITLLMLYWPLTLEKEGTVSFFDVGQGDAALIQTPEARFVLVDGGGTIEFGKKQAWQARRDPFEVGEDVLVPLLKKRGVHELELLVVSHQDADHIGGLSAVLENIPVKRIVFNGTLKPTPQAQQLFSDALSKGVELVEVRAGDEIKIDDDTNIQVLSPLEDDGSANIEVAKEQNERSVVFLLRMMQRTFMFTGDIDAPRERAILHAHQATPIDVLKVAHHGSKSSTVQEWIDAWQPNIAVISAGRNNLYRHPHPDVLERLEDEQVKIYRTDQQGEISIVVDEGKLTVHHEIE